MKVFISWSGKRSKALANALRDWLPMVLQYVEPWVSDKDISAGDRWAQAIAGELEASNFGIICITPENLHSEWILFESGALSKSMLDAKVIPLLYGLELSDLSGPLSQFQAQKMEESGMMEVVKAINKIPENSTSDQIVEQLVPALWPRLQEALKNIPDTESNEKHMRPQHDILEELVAGVRGINSRICDLEPELAERDIASERKRWKRFYPRMVHKILMESGGGEGREPLQLLILAGLCREDFPWMAEILSEAYREVRDGEIESAEKILMRVRKMTKYMNNSKMFHKMSGGSMEIIILVNELPMYLDMAMDEMIPDRKPIDEDESN